MVSATFVCLLAIGLSAASSQLMNEDVESFFEGPISDRRTFKHGKPLKLLPLIKKHKKFAKLVPHVFSKATYSEIPIIHEAPKPVFKVHRYQGIEVKPLPDVAFSTPETIVESHSIEPPSGDFLPTYTSNHYLSAPVHSSSVLLYPVNEKPIFPAPVFAPLQLPPKAIFSFVPAPPITAIASSPAFSSLSVARPALNPISTLPAQVFTPIPPSPPPQPTFLSTPIKIQAPVLPPLPAPSPAPIHTSIPVKIQAPLLPPAFAPSSGNVFSPVSVKIPAPILPTVPTPSPAPVFPSISTPSPTPEPAFPSLPVSLPPVQFSVVPSPAPSVSFFPPPTPALPSISVSTTKQIPEPEYPYPPSGSPIASYIKDISLGDIEIKNSPLTSIETPKYEEITTGVNIEPSKSIEHVLGGIRNENGFLQKIKGWKVDKANAALSHFAHFKNKPAIQSISFPSHKAPVEVSTPTPSIFPTLQFPVPSQPLPLGTAPVYFPPAPFFPPAKYENFPPNNIESPPIFNSYGAPVPQGSYASTFASHDRLSSAASEEEPAILPAPSAEKQEQNHETHQLPSQIRQEFQTQNFQPQLQQQQGILQNHPVYVAENDKTPKEENKTTEDAQPETDDYDIQKEPKADEAANKAHHYLNHKE